MQSFWNADPKGLDDYQSTPTLPASADIVIVGSGLSGVATSYFLLKDNPNPSFIVLLEARQICSGATGRNGGHVKPDTYSNIPKFAKLLGIEAASQLAEFEASHVHAVKELVETEKLDCDFNMTRAIDVYLDTTHANEVETTYKSLEKQGIVNLRDVAVASGKDAERVSGFELYNICLVNKVFDTRSPVSKMRNVVCLIPRLTSGRPSLCTSYSPNCFLKD